MSLRWWAAVAAGVFLLGCGGANKALPSAPQAPDGEHQYGQPEADAEQSPESEAGGTMLPGDDDRPRPKRDRFQSVRPQTRYAEPPSSNPGERRGADDEQMRLLEDFTVAESLALSGQAGCEHACRALRSMIRSADRLCGLAQYDQEERVCTEARRRVRNARDFVRSSCGRCVHGPNLDED